MDDIIQEIEKLSGKYNNKTIFNDLVTMWAISISNALDMQEERENEYMDISKKYTREQLDSFSRIIAMITILMGDDYRDILGELFMKLKVANDKDQYFTPIGVAMLLNDITVLEEQKQTISVSDPACGSGIMFIAKAGFLASKGINYQKVMRVEACDKERLVLLMCYIQTSIYGIDAICKVGDSLEGYVDEVWYTPMHYWNVKPIGTAS